MMLKKIPIGPLLAIQPFWSLTRLSGKEVSIRKRFIYTSLGYSTN